MGAAAIPLIAAGAQAYGMIDSANQANEAKQKELELKRQQAAEIDARQAINEEILSRQGQQHIAQTESSGNKYGNTGPGFHLEAMHNLQEAILLSRRDADFKARMLRAGIGVESQISSDQVNASYIRSGGAILGGFSQAYGNTSRYGAPSDPKSLGSYYAGDSTVTGPTGGFQSDPTYSRYA